MHFQHAPLSLLGRALYIPIVFSQKEQLYHLILLIFLPEKKCIAVHDNVPVMWAFLPCPFNDNEIMALWLHSHFWFFLLIPHASCIGVQAFQSKKLSLDRCKRIHHCHTHLWVVGICSHLGAQLRSIWCFFGLAWAIPQLDGITQALPSWILLSWVFQFKTYLTKLVSLLPKIPLPFQDRCIPSFPNRL